MLSLGLSAVRMFIVGLTFVMMAFKVSLAARQQLCADKIEAIGKAIGINSSVAGSGKADKHLPTLLQAKPSSLA